jgi:hypothetical protein
VRRRGRPLGDERGRRPALSRPAPNNRNRTETATEPHPLSDARVDMNAGLSPCSGPHLLIANLGSREHSNRTKAIVRSRAGRFGSAPSNGRRTTRPPSSRSPTIVRREGVPVIEATPCPPVRARSEWATRTIGRPRFRPVGGLRRATRGAGRARILGRVNPQRARNLIRTTASALA